MRKLWVTLFFYPSSIPGSGRVRVRVRVNPTVYTTLDSTKLNTAVQSGRFENPVNDNIPAN